jgi:ATP-dependent DNA helicase RecG
MALPENIGDLLNDQSVESVHLELKADWNPQDIWQTICAFANDFNNLGGGYIIVGVEERDGVPMLPPVGLDINKLDAIQKEILNCGSSCIKPEYHPIVKPYTFDTRNILVIYAAAGSHRPYRVKLALKKDCKDYGYFIRRHSSTVRAKEHEKSELMSMATKKPFDDSPNHLAKIDDLSRDLMLAYLQDIKSDLTRHANEISTIELAQQIQIITEQPHAASPLNVGLLFFNPNPDQFIPETKIIVVAFGAQGPGGNIIEKKIFLGPLPRMINESLNYIKNKYINDIIIKHPDRAEATHVQNFPFPALEEALVNAVLHRNYQEREPIEVRIMRDALIVLSYPGPDRAIDMDVLRAGKIRARRYRNQRIGHFLNNLKLAEKLATGIPKIINAMSENGSPPPIFDTDEDRTFFEVYLPAHPMTLEMLSASVEQTKSKAPIFHLPGQYLTPHFCDPLNHLGALHQQLQGSHNTALLAAATVQGMGGVGKTQLAVKYCHAYRTEYAGVWWFPCDSMTLLEQECQHFCHVNGIAVPDGMAASGALREWLTTQPRWLLVYDNADNAADRDALRACLPHPGVHHVLITSRLHTWAQMPTLRLDVWTGEQALPFLRERLPDAHETQLLALNAALGGLPLALEQACTFINNNQFPLADYITRINAAEQAPALLDEHASPQCARSVTATLSLAFDKLSAPAQALLQLCGWLAPEPIPEYLFTENPDALPPILQPIARDQIKWRKTVAELHNYALCQVRDITMTDHAGNGGTVEKCLVLHRLTQAAVRSGGGKATGDAQDARATHNAVAAISVVIILLCAVFPSEPQHPRHWPRCRALMPHIQVLQQYDAQDGQSQVSYAWLLNQLALYLKSGPALWGESQRLDRLSLAISQTALGEEHPDTLASMNNLATTLWQQGDLPGARSLHEKTLDIRIRVLGADHPDTLASMNNLAATLWHQGDLPGARALHEKTLDIRIRALGADHPDTLLSMNNLAETLHRQGDLSGARALLEKTLDIRSRVLGADHPSTLASMNNLAETLWQQGDLPGARALQEKTLDIRVRVLGADHPHTLISKGNLACTLHDMGETSAAQALFDDVAAAKRRAATASPPPA